MKKAIHLAWLPLLACQLAVAQTAPPASTGGGIRADCGGFQPSTLNQAGKQYPMVNSEGRVRFRIVAAQAQSVRVHRACDGFHEGRVRRMGQRWPLDGKGFHYYHINIDGADVPDPGTRFFYGSSRWAAD